MSRLGPSWERLSLVLSHDVSVLINTFSTPIFEDPPHGMHVFTFELVPCFLCVCGDCAVYTTHAYHVQRNLPLLPHKWANLIRYASVST